MALKKIKPIIKIDGEIIFDLSSDEANSDPIRTARLIDNIERGNKKSIKNFIKLQNTLMYREE